MAPPAFSRLDRDMTTPIRKLREKIAEARALHHRQADEMTARQQGASGAFIVAMQKEFSALIAKGAKPCPGCGQPPMGIEHQTQYGFSYEVGCIACKRFAHTDGTAREFSARGGTLPKHAVEAWNEGPDYWRKTAKPVEGGK